MERLGLVLHHGIESGAELARYGQAAETHGFDSLWVTERYFHEETAALLGYLAASTTTLRLGVGVVNPYTRHPALTAMAAATLDRISGGRMLLGLGRSERDVIEARLGIPYGHGRDTVEAAVDLIRRLLAGESVAEGGGRFRLNGAKLAIRPARDTVPIYLAAIGPKALRLAGRIADGVLLNAYVSPAYVRWAVGVLHEAARAAGRDPAAIDVACMLVVRLTDDPGALMPASRERLVRLLAEPHVGEILLETSGFDPAIAARIRAAVAAGERPRAVALVDDAMVASCYLLGSAARCRERIAAYRAAGVDAPLLLPPLGDYARVAEALRPT
jgi:5,10-methylenetetrahydromethanopterin reductase